MTLGRSETSNTQAINAGMEAFRKELEDENQHLDDAVRIGILVALDTYARLLREGER